MSPSITVSEETKREWDELKAQHEEDVTHDEFAQHAIECIRRDNGTVINPAEIVDGITEQTASEVELASYRGTRSALNEVLGNDK